jgi:hypothetical protein
MWIDSALHAPKTTEALANRVPTKMAIDEYAMPILVKTAKI